MNSIELRPHLSLDRLQPQSAAEISLLEALALGAMGRVCLGGEERDVEGVEGRNKN